MAEDAGHQSDLTLRAGCLWLHAVAGHQAAPGSASPGWLYTCRPGCRRQGENHERDQGQDRASCAGLAKKGRIDAEGKGVISISDELHCLMVITNALIRGLDSVILTADEDYVEIFFKAQWFFDTHYRAWLAAKLVKDGHYGPPVKELADTHGYFNGPLTLYRRHTQQLQETLPSIYETVSVGLVYVTPHGQIRMMVFPFERQMLDMLKTRADTNGRCTDLFGDANIHVDLGPLKGKLDGLYLGIGHDKGTTIKTSGIQSFLAKMRPGALADLLRTACASLARPSAWQNSMPRASQAASAGTRSRSPQRPRHAS